jgi:hypothetical protein
MTFTRDLQQGMSPYKAQAIECLKVLLKFLKNPVQGVRDLPNWDWATLVVFHTALAAAFGFLGGLISLRLGRVFSGLIIFPISTLFIVAVISGFFYYTFLFIYHRELDFKKLATLVVFANLPNIFLALLAYHVPPISLLGVAATGMLLIVGLTEMSQIEKKKVAQLVGGIVAIYLAFWIYGAISTSYERHTVKDFATPESLDILEQELGDE